MQPAIIAPLVALACLGGIALVELERDHPPHLVAAAALSDPLQYAEIAPAPPAPPAAASSTEDVPILVYHVVRPAYPTDSAAVRALAQTPEVFDAQMAHLRDAGYHVVPMAALEAHLASSTPLPAKPIVINFDDGWRDQFNYAFPILEKYGYPATFFVFTNAIGRPDFMTWDDLKSMLGAGMTIGDHTRSHPYLTRISSPSALWNEIVGSRMLLERELGVPVREFAYPFGQSDASTTAMVESAGYASARGDYYTGTQSLAKLYHLSALNAPTSIEAFDRRFP